MPEFSEQALHSAIPVGTDQLTSAPGDLPTPEIAARIAAQRGQFRHDNTIEPLAPQPAQAVEVWATSGEEINLEQATLFYTTDGRQPDTSAHALPLERVRMDWDMQTGYLTRWRTQIPAQPAGTRVRYRIGGWSTIAGNKAGAEPERWAQDGQGFAFRLAGEQAVTTFAFVVEEATPLVPAWIENAVIYQIFLDRFRSSTPGGNFAPNSDPNEIHGGTLRGVRDALPYLADLGAMCLWLSPLHPAESYHRYDTTDFYTVDPRLGTKEDLKELTTRAHELGIRVLLDFVPSHVSWHHPAFLAAQRDPDAPSFEWFTFDHWPERYRCFLGVVPSLPSLRTASEGARAHVIDSALQWMRDYGIDGFRLDHAIGHGMDFWAAFRQATRVVSPNVFLVGEVTDTPDSLLRYRGKLDSILDFPLASALRHTFGVGNWTLRTFDRFLSAYEQFMTPGPGRVSFLDNHDMNRFLFLARNDQKRLQLAALCQFTLVAIPVIYYGTEVGMTQRYDTAERGDAEARQDMSWHKDNWDLALLAFYQALTRMRRVTPVLAQGTRRTLHLDEQQQTYAYLRSYNPRSAIETGDVLVLFNLSGIARTISLNATPATQSYRCLLTTAGTPTVSKMGDRIKIVLAPESGAALLVE